MPDYLSAGAVGLASLAIYLVTLYPGLGGGGDAAKFQYIGSVLGTPHPPGYSLYVLLSFLFAQLPIGSLAYRINLMSAIAGMAAVVGVFITLRKLGCHRIVAACAALARPCDRLPWYRGVGAEVYALNAGLIGLIIWLALRWSATGRDLYLTVAASR